MPKYFRAAHTRASAHHPPQGQVAPQKVALRPLALLAILLAVLTMLPAGTASTKEPTSPPPAGVVNTCSGKQISYQFLYNDSDTVGIDKGCADKNEVTRAINPNLVATSSHVSCSDQFPGGLGTKSDLGEPTVASRPITSPRTVVRRPVASAIRPARDLRRAST